MRQIGWIGVLFLSAVSAFASEQSRGWLGIRMAPRTALEQAVKQDVLPEAYQSIPRVEALLESWTGSGVLVLEVIPETPAEAAGLFPGDVIQEFNHIRIDTPHTLAALMRRAVPGRDGSLGILRDGELRELLFTVGERAEENVEQTRSDASPQPREAEKE